jgi:hypothetical protein
MTLNCLKEFKVLCCFIQKPISACLYRIVSSFWLALLFDEKIRQNAAQPVIRTRLGDTKPPSNIKCIVPAFYGNQFGGKDGGLRTHTTRLPKK